MRKTTVGFGVLAALTACAVFAQDALGGSSAATSKLGIIETSKQACEQAYATKNLRPLRGKMPLGLREETTEEMRSNETTPNAAERAAFSAYRVAQSACFKFLMADLYHGDEKAVEFAIKNKNSKTEFDAALNLLAAGKVTYAEYFRQVDKFVDARAETLLRESGIDVKSYEHSVEAWLAVKCQEVVS